MSRPCIIICNFNDKEAKLLKTYGSMMGLKDQIRVNWTNGNTLVKDILKEHPEYSSWVLDEGAVGAGELPIKAKREGEVPGIHTVTYKSNVDEIQIYHSAYSRDGFAQGAVMAAEFLMGKKGVFGMEDLLKI